MEELKAKKLRLDIDSALLLLLKAHKLVPQKSAEEFKWQISRRLNPDGICDILGICKQFRDRNLFRGRLEVLKAAAAHIQAVLAGMPRLPYFFIAGFPGSGKTRTLVEVARVALEEGHLVFVTTFNYTHDIGVMDSQFVDQVGPDFILAIRLIHVYLNDINEPWILWADRLFKNVKGSDDLRLITCQNVLNLFSSIFDNKKKIVLAVDECLLPLSRGHLNETNLTIMVQSIFQLQSVSLPNINAAVVLSAMTTTIFETDYKCDLSNSGSSIVRHFLQMLSVEEVSGILMNLLQSKEYIEVKTALRRAHPSEKLETLMDLLAGVIGGLPRALEAAHLVVNVASNTPIIRTWNLSSWVLPTCLHIQEKYTVFDQFALTYVFTGEFISTSTMLHDQQSILDSCNAGIISVYQGKSENNSCKCRVGTAEYVRLIIPTALAFAYSLQPAKDEDVHLNRITSLWHLLFAPFRAPRNEFEEMIARSIILKSWWRISTTIANPLIDSPSFTTLGKLFQHASCTSDFPSTAVIFPYFHHELQVWPRLPCFELSDINRVTFRKDSNWVSFICEPCRQNEPGVDLCLILPCPGDHIEYIAVGLQMKHRSSSVDGPTLHEAWLNFVSAMAARGWPEERLYFVFIIWGTATQKIINSPELSLSSGRRWSRVAILSSNPVPIKINENLISDSGLFQKEGSLFLWLGPTLTTIAGQLRTAHLHETPHTEPIYVSPEDIKRGDAQRKDKLKELKGKYKTSEVLASLRVSIVTLMSQVDEDD